MGTVVDIGTHQGRHVVAIRHERALSVTMPRNVAMQAYVESLLRPDVSEEERQRLLDEATAHTRRRADRDGEVHEASLVRISSEEGVLSRSHVSAGLAAYVCGLTMLDGEPVAYGALGGVPAVSRHSHGTWGLAPKNQIVGKSSSSTPTCWPC